MRLVPVLRRARDRLAEFLAGVVLDGERSVDLDDSRCGRGWLLIVLCRFSAVVSG